MCFSTDGKRLLAILQSPLIQDGALNERGERIGTHVRMIECTLADGSFREFVYTLDDPAFGINELIGFRAVDAWPNWQFDLDPAADDLTGGDPAAGDLMGGDPAAGGSVSFG